MSRRTARLAVGLALLLAVACGGESPIADTDLRILVEPETLEVETGKPVRLVVTRTWSKDLEPSPWDDAALSPLVTRLESTARRENATHHEETLVYRAYAMALDDVKVPSVLFAGRPTVGGNPRVVTTPAFVLRVKPALDPEAPGDPEAFGTMQAEPFRWTAWLVVLGLLALGGVVWRLRRTAPTSTERTVEPPATTPAECATAALAAVDTGVVEAAEILRVYVFEQFTVRTRERTTDEVREAPPIVHLPAAAQTALAEVLQVADLVKFACHEPEQDDDARLVEVARSFVDQTRRTP